MTLTDHEITVEQVKLVIREGEGLTVEFKERYTPRIDEDIVAFTNAKGGTLLLGLRDEADEARVKNAGILFFAKDVYDHLHQAQMTLLAFKGKGKAGERSIKAAYGFCSTLSALRFMQVCDGNL